MGYLYLYEAASIAVAVIASIVITYYVMGGHSSNLNSSVNSPSKRAKNVSKFSKRGSSAHGAKVCYLSFSFF